MFHVERGDRGILAIRFRGTMTKTNTADAMAEFLARGGKITDCGSTMQQAKSLRSMRREDAARFEADDTDHEVINRENAVRDRLARTFG